MVYKGKEAMGFEKILDVFFLWLDPEERRQSKFLRNIFFE
jgi:hypothetical protein